MLLTQLPWTQPSSVSQQKFQQDPYLKRETKIVIIITKNR
jgi:hypothetical protein